MSAVERAVEVMPGSDLDRLLAEAEQRPVLLLRAGRRFRLSVADVSPDPSDAGDVWASYDADRLMAGVRRAAGTISEEEAEAMIADIFRWREEGSQEPPQP